MKKSQTIFFILFLLNSFFGQCPQWNENMNEINLTNPKKIWIKMNQPELTEAEHVKSYIFNFYDPDLLTETDYLLIKKRLSFYREYNLKPFGRISSEISEGDLVSCQKDDKFVYYIKKLISLKTFCKDIDAIYPQTIVPDNIDSYDRFSDLFNSNSCLIGSGKNGVVKEFERTIKNEKKEVILKRIDRKNLKLNELYYLELLSNEDIAPRYYGCQYNSDFVYMMQESMLYDLSSKAFRDYYDRFSMIDRCDFIIDLSQTVQKLHDLGISHSDIKPLNMMIDKKGRIKLIDFDGAVPFGAKDSQVLTFIYSHPLRPIAETAHPFFDFYTLLMLIIELETPYHSLSFEWDLKNHRKQGPICFGQNRPDHCFENIRQIIRLDIKDRWAIESSSEQIGKKESLGEILERVVCESAIERNLNYFDVDEQMTLRKFIGRMKEIKTEFKRKAEENSSNIRLI